MRRPAALAALLASLSVPAVRGSTHGDPGPAAQVSDEEPVARAGDVVVTADTLSYDWASRRSTFTGNVRAVRGDGYLRADRGTYEAGMGILTLTGRIFGVPGR